MIIICNDTDDETVMGAWKAGAVVVLWHLNISWHSAAKTTAGRLMQLSVADSGESCSHTPAVCSAFRISARNFQLDHPVRLLKF